MESRIVGRPFPLPEPTRTDWDNVTIEVEEWGDWLDSILMGKYFWRLRGIGRVYRAGYGDPSSGFARSISGAEKKARRAIAKLKKEDEKENLVLTIRP